MINSNKVRILFVQDANVLGFFTLVSWLIHIKAVTNIAESKIEIFSRISKTSMKALFYYYLLLDFCVVFTFELFEKNSTS